MGGTLLGGLVGRGGCSAGGCSKPAFFCCTAALMDVCSCGIRAEKGRDEDVALEGSQSFRPQLLSRTVRRTGNEASIKSTHVYMWQSRVENEHYFVAYFDRIRVFKAPYL